MRACARVLLVVALLVPLAGCGRTKFQEFSPSDGDFTVLLPGSPDRKEQDVAGMKVGVYEVGHRSGTFKVMFADLPLVPPADFLGAAVTGLADQRRGTVVTRSDAGQNGREFEIETADPKGFVSGRVIAAGNRLYFLTAEGENLGLSDSDVRSFLVSVMAV